MSASTSHHQINIPIVQPQPQLQPQHQINIPIVQPQQNPQPHPQQQINIPIVPPKPQQQINIPIVPPKPQHPSKISNVQPQRQLNLPLADLLVGPRGNYIEMGVPLYEASIKGNWKAAEAILKKQPRLIRSAITENYETPLHIAASVKNTKQVQELVKNLMNLMVKTDLELQNKNGNTALHLAAAAGNVEMAKIMVNENEALLEIPSSQEMMPLYTAALFGNHDMVRYLYDNSRKMTGDFWTDQNRGWVLQKCVENELFDVALKIVNDHPEFATNKSVLGFVLLALAPKTKAFDGVKPNIIWRIIKYFFGLFCLEVGPAEKDSKALQLLKILWKNIAMMSKNEIDAIIRGPASGYRNQRHSSTVLFVAAKMGNTRFIIELIRLYPDLIWKVSDKGLSIFHMAVKCRHESIYNLLYEIGSMKELITPLKDKNGNNMLHLLGTRSKPKRFQTALAVALEMQRELLWFEEVEKMIPPAYRERKNDKGETPHELFTKKHKDLVKIGEDWMKNTASQCMVVATLIATIVFAAAFTLPGGYNQNTGIPFFLPRSALIVFVISDAISLILSSASVLMFLSILTSRYAERDFLKSSPKKLLFGLTLLFLSIMTMMVTFGSSFFILYHQKLKWVPFVVTGIAAMPVILFAILQFPLLKEVFYSTYRSRYLFKPKKHMLYD